MNTKNIMKNACTILVLASILLTVQSANAVPVQGQYIDAAHCDNHGPQDLTHELGDATVFPVDEGIFVDPNPTSQTVCVPDDGIANDWEVRMINMSNIPYYNLFFVVDEGYSVGNYDGMIQDVVVPGYTQAFRIDGTVTAGLNNNLVFESMTVDEVFEPGEVWTFLISNFSTLAPPSFTSAGKFAVSSSFDPVSNASILANQLPEPASLILLTLASTVMLRHPKRRRLA